MEAVGSTWNAPDYCLGAEADFAPPAWQRLAAKVYARVCRTHLSTPGFSLIDLGPATSSRELLRAMVELVQALQ